MHRLAARASYGLAVAALLAGFSAGTAQAETKRFNAALNPTQEVPAVNSKGTGTARLTLDTTSKKLTWTVNYSNLSGPPTMAHIHGPGQPGENAGVVIDLAPGGVKKGPMTGTATLTDAQINDLLAGKYYVNVHTEQNQGGEIRGQLYP